MNNRIPLVSNKFKDEIFKYSDIHASKYYLLYIDILGMEKKFDSDDSEYYLNIINMLYKKTIQIIQKLYEEINNIKIDIRIFSDNIVIAIKQEDNQISTRESIKQTLIIEIAAFFQVLALLYALPVRGGITIDDFYIDKTFVYGKALTRAHYLENEIAIYPRIIIDNDYTDLFTMSQYLQQFIIKDTDNVSYINPFECYFNVSKIYKEDEIKHLRTILWTMLPESNSCKVNQKIYWLVNRFNEFCKNNNFEKYLLEIDKLPRLSKILAETFEQNEIIDKC